MATNVSGQDFEAVPEITGPPEPGSHTLSGAVSGPVVANVTINLQGTATNQTSTNVSGNYSFANLPSGVYVVTPVLAGHTFNPPHLIVNLTDNSGANNFTSIAPPVPDVYNLSGTIIGVVVQGVTVNLSGTASAQTTTNNYGDYNFPNLAEGTYVIVPTYTGCDFIPPFRVITLPNA